jgi:high-affinity iron transporter
VRGFGTGATGAGGDAARTRRRHEAPRRPPTAHSRRRALRFFAVAGLAAMTGAAAAAGTLDAGPPAAAAKTSRRALPTIALSASACGPRWDPPTSGQHLLEVENASRHTVYDVELVGQNQVNVYGEIEMLAPGTTVPMDATLPPGRYSFECENDDGSDLYSDAETVSGAPVADAPSYEPVTVDEIETADLAYRRSLAPVMTRFESEAANLESAVASGNLALARSLWLEADLDWQRMGAVYDTFGKFGTEIDQSPLGLLGTVRDPRFTGLLRLELGLWHGQSAAELTPVAERLVAAVEALVKAFPTMLMTDIDLPLRTHEILENTLQFQLTGELDEGAGDELALAWADVQGTQLALGALRTLLQANDPSLLDKVAAGLRQMGAAFKAYEQPGGSWTPLPSLTTIQRERLDGQLGALLQELDQVPDVLDLPLLPPTADGS